jgi:RHS repeat-associated protein
MPVPGEPFAVPAAAATEGSLGASPISLRSTTAYSGPSPTDFSPELQSLANGLDRDPLRIFNYVRTQVEFQPYYRCDKGAHLTYLDGAGNDMDQACLLIALLNQANGVTATSFVLGRLSVPDSSADGNSLSAWLGLPAPLAVTALNNSHTPFQGSTPHGSYTTWTFDHVWVRATINGTTYDLDPSFKSSEVFTAIDFKTASGFSRSQLLSDSGGTETTDYVQNLNRVGVETRLAQYTASLVASIKVNQPNAETVQVFGGARIVAQPVSTLAAGAPLPAFYPSVASTTATLPAQYIATFRVQIDSDVDVTFPIPALQGNRLSIVFSGSNAQLWFNDTQVAAQTSGGIVAGVATTAASVACTLTHGDGSAQTTPAAGTTPINYPRAGAAYALTYAVYSNPRSTGLIDASNRRLQTYLANGRLDSSREVLTESLHLLGIKWVRHVALETAMVARLNNLIGHLDHIIGHVSQESSYYVEMPGVVITMADTAGINYKWFNAAAFLSSAMEHGVIEQSGGPASLSSMKCLTVANDQGYKIYKATAANYSTGLNVQSIIAATYPSNILTTFGTMIGSGWIFLLHENGQIGLSNPPIAGQWKGYGFTGINQKIWNGISGDLNGGHTSIPEQLSGWEAMLEGLMASVQQTQPSSISNPVSPEPVDLLTGAYTMEHADLTLGEMDSPRGLNFTRYYDSSRRLDNSTLGNGWRHSCEGNVMRSSEIDNAFGLIQPADAAQTVIGILAAGEFVDKSYPPKELLLGVIAANWTVNRILNNAANVRLGNRCLTYISQPDGSWCPPPGTTTALTGTNGAFTLTPRFGGSIVFDTKDRIGQWKDVDNNTQSYTYDDTDIGFMVYPAGGTPFWVTTHAASKELATVKDQFGRTLTFTYYSSGASSGLLQNVADSTGRTVKYSYTAGTAPAGGVHLTQITDPESFNTTLFYDSRHRITDWLDHTSAVVTHNEYDILDRVAVQRSQGIASRVWKFLYSPGQTIQIDPANGMTAYRFDCRNRTTDTVDALGNASSSFYDGQNHIVKSIDATGRQTLCSFDGNLNLAKTTDNAGKSTIYTYETSAPWHLLTVTDATSKSTTYGYDARNHLTSAIDPGLRKTQYFYRPDGLPDHTIDSAGNTTSITAYDSYGNPIAVTRADATRTSATYNTRGDLLTSTDGRGQTTTFAYDKRRLPRTRTDALTNVTTWTYDSNGNPATVTNRNGKLTSFTYDNLDHLKGIQAPDTGAVTYTYDTRDWLTGLTDPLSHTTTTGYDAAGRRVSVTNALSVVIAQSSYDSAGRQSTQKDGLNHETKLIYNTAGRLDYTLDPLAQETDHTYDDAGRPLTLKNRRGRTFSFSYATDGLASAFTYPTGRQSQITARDAYGLPQTLKSPTGNITGITYDALGRISGRTDGVGAIAWTYDNESNPTDVKETIVGNTATIHRVFDAMGRLTSCTDTQGFTIAYTYDPEGNVKTIVYPGNKTVAYTYDGANRLKTVTDWTSRVTTYTYDTAGRLQTVLRPNNTRQRVDFDAANRLTASYEEKMSGSTVVGTLWEAGYGYDNANRLTSFNPAPLATNVAPPATSMTYDADNQLATYNGATVGCDLDGNLLVAPVNGTLLGALGWDKRNRLTSAGGVTYTYDAENRRVSSTSAGQTAEYVYSRAVSLDRLLLKQNSDGSLTRYVYGVGLLYEVPFAANGTEGNPTYYHFDWRGDTVALSDTSGNVTARLSYSPYGERTVESGTVNTPFCFNGKFGVMTEPSGLLYMQARFYSPILKHFLNEDPAGFAGGRNLYAYCSGDPVNAMDPFGLGPVGSAASSGVASSLYNPNVGKSNWESTITCHGMSASGWNGNTMSFSGIGQLTGSARSAKSLSHYSYSLTENGPELVTEIMAATVILAPAILGRFAAAESRPIQGPPTATTRVSNRPGNQSSVELNYPDGRRVDINADRVKEWGTATDPRAPAGTMQKVPFENAQPGSKGFKRDPTPAELEILKNSLPG